MPIDHAIYPKKEGIFISFSSHIALTIKLGPFPIYEFAPIKTAPTDMALRYTSGTPTIKFVVIPLAMATLCAVAINTR